MVALFAISIYIVYLVAQPIVWWKVCLIASMIGLFALCVALPVGRKVFDLHFGPWYQWMSGLVVAAVACVVLEVLWRTSGHHSISSASPNPEDRDPTTNSRPPR
jgi:cation-transporting ATPase E